MAHPHALRISPRRGREVCSNKLKIYTKPQQPQKLTLDDILYMINHSRQHAPHSRSREKKKTHLGTGREREKQRENKLGHFSFSKGG